MLRLLLLIFAGSLHADPPLTHDQMVQYSYVSNERGEVCRTFRRDGDGIVEVYEDNRKDHCCPELGIAALDDEQTAYICKQILAGAEGLGLKVIDFRVFSKNGVPLTFNVAAESKSFYAAGLPGASDGMGESCCANGRIDKDAKVHFTDNVFKPKPDDYEMLGMTRTSKEITTRWRTKCSGDISEDFLNEVKATSAFYRDDCIYYLARGKDEIKTFSVERYEFDSEKPFEAWSNEAAKVFEVYTPRDIGQHPCKNIGSMLVYEDWLTFSTWCPNEKGLCCRNNGYDPDEATYYFKRIKHKWVLVYDGMLDEDPRYGFIKDSTTYKGVTMQQLPEALWKIRGR